MATAYVADEGGIALVITLLVVALVTVLVLEFHFDAVVELDLAANYAEDVQAYHLALSGVSFARALLLRDDDSADGMEDLWHSISLIPACFPPQQLLSMAGDGGGSIFLDTLGEGQGQDAVGDGQGCVSLRIVDEQGKLPLNALMPEGDSSDPNPIWRPIFEAFFVNFQIDEDLLDALVDWIDVNDQSGGIGGAERTYYAGLEHPYEPPNKPMRSLGDLRQIRGFDYETLAKLFPGRPPEAMADIDLGTNRYLTVYGSKQGAKVNLNTADEEVLRALCDGLQAGCAADLVEDLVSRRQEGQLNDLQAVNDLISDAAVFNQLKQVADVKSHFFRVESLGKVGDIKKRVVAVLERRDDDTTIVYFKVE
ncbi:MAG: type II secretion system minor pseudopilin GspK [bacterium]|nr:type II secretion system minor pseudopilin GspK [bacterium]